MQTHRHVVAVSADVDTPLDRGDGVKVFCQLLAVVLTLGAWNTENPALRALPYTGVLVHEHGHIVAALCSGGTAKRVSLQPDEGGSARTAGGFAPLVGLAGYFAPCLLGALWLVASGRRFVGTWVSSLTFVGAVAMQLVPMDHWTRMVAAVLAALAGVAMFSCWGHWSWPFGSFVLRLGGTYWCLYAISDLWGDCFAHPSLGSDVAVLSQWLQLPMSWVGAAWVLLLVVLTIAAFRLSVQRTPVKILPVIR